MSPPASTRRVDLSTSPRRLCKGTFAPVIAGFLCGALVLVFLSPLDSSNGTAHVEEKDSSASFLGTLFGRGGAAQRPKYSFNNHVATARSAATRRANHTLTVTPEKEQEAEPNFPASVPLPAPGDTPDWLLNTALVSMATGDDSAKDAVALFRSLRDAGTQIPNLVVLLVRGGVGSKDCHNVTWKKSVGREDINCQNSEGIAPEIASQKYLDAFDEMNVQYKVVDMLPETKYTVIPGGRQIFWGMAFNKLLVFNMTQYRKLLWMDSDAYVVKNIDSLMKEPMFTASIVTACCHPNGPGYAGGGIWVVEPGEKVFGEIMDLIAGPVPGTVDGVWHWGDMQVVRHYFGASPPDGWEPLWPAINELRHGYAPGLRHFPLYRNMTTEEFDKWIDEKLDRTKQRREGFIEELWTDHSRAAWRALDIRYDQCVGHYQCAPERDAPDVVFSVHFSCLHDVRKPGNFETENDLLTALYTYAEGATRYWFLRWYETYKSAMGRYPEPYYTGPPVPGYNQTHDVIVFANRIARDKAGRRM